MTTQIIGYTNGQYINGTPEVIEETATYRITRYGAASYGLKVGDVEELHYVTEEEARRYAEVW